MICFVPLDNFLFCFVVVFFLKNVSASLHYVSVRAAYSSGKFLKVDYIFVTFQGFGARAVANCYPSS